MQTIVASEDDEVALIELSYTRGLVRIVDIFTIGGKDGSWAEGQLTQENESF
jgi:hypothetical protein